MRDDLLATKFHVPRIRTERLARSRLIDRLDEGMARDVILVATPAGFGKTTLLAGWSAGAKWPIAWLSLDPEDNDPARFWRYMIAALDRVCGRLGERGLSTLTAGGAVSTRDVVTALINELEATSEELALVLDDYHAMESASIHDDVGFLLTHLPPQLHVVITTRSDPPLPLARLRATGQLAELRATDLRFTAEESSAFLREVWGLDLPPEAIAAVEARTEGWAVGLQLAALSLRERPDPGAFLDAFAGSHRYVLDYLSEEVLAQQSDDVKTFLLESSILERLSGPLCDAVTGRTDGQDMLEGLERANLFLVPLDEERRWFRFHHLFGELLRVRLHRAGPDRVADLHRRAAAWCEHRGLVDDAIRHASASGDAMWAAGLVEQHLNETIQRGETVILQRWLSGLPDDAVRSSPTLTFAQGWMQFHLGHLDSVERLLEEAEGAFKHRRGSSGFQLPTDIGPVADAQAAVALLRAALAGVRGDTEEMAQHARIALALMGEEENAPRFWARWLSGTADWMRGRLADAEQFFADMLSEGRRAANPYPLMVSSLALGRVQQARGNLSAALRTYREGLRRATEGGRFSTFNAGEAHWGIAHVLYERNEIDDALEHATRSIELWRQVNWFMEQDRRLATLAWIRYAKGDVDAALEVMNGIEPRPDVASHWAPAATERARLLLAKGRVEEVERWAEERGLADDDDVSYVRERDHLVLARVLLARSDPTRALRLLTRLDANAESQQRMDSLIRIRVLSSLALQASGDHPGALAMVADALSLARPQGYVRVFADEGPPMIALLRSLVTARRRGGGPAIVGAARDHLNRVVQAFGPPVGRTEQGRAATPPLVEPLTNRELEILRLIAEGKRNHEIAKELVVTLDTVKRHVSNIFSKLGSSSRVQAVTRARELNLIT